MQKIIAVNSFKNNTTIISPLLLQALWVLQQHLWMGKEKLYLKIFIVFLSCNKLKTLYSLIEQFEMETKGLNMFWLFVGIYLNMQLIKYHMGNVSNCGNCYITCQAIDYLTRQKKWRIMVNADLDQKFKMLMEPQFKGLLNILNKIPDNVFIKFMQRVNLVLFESDPCCGFNYKKNFINWGKTFETVYQNILYPTEFPAQTQTQEIQNFVAAGVQAGKRIRGSGIRHSWGKIFSDPQQLLVSFYPYQVAKGTSRQLEEWAIKMGQVQNCLCYDQKEFLNEIRLMGQYQQNSVKKYLVKIGAGVSNDQLRRWCIKEGYQYKSNVIMVEVNVCGGLGTCSHGAGRETQTLADYVYEIQFIDYTGKRQIISKKESPDLIKSAASALGLLGLVVFVTMEFDKLDIVRLLPRNEYKDFVIPWPKDYPEEKIKARKERPEYKKWPLLKHKKVSDQNWENNFKQFKKAVNETYCQWFYFPIEELHVFENVWNVFDKKTPENLLKIKQDNKDGVFVNDYPPPAIKFFSQFATFAGNVLVNSWVTQSAVNILMRNPYVFFPHRNFYINYPDAVHFQRGIQNMRVRDFQVQIDIPSVDNAPDYNLIQWLWWDALQIVEQNKDVVNMALQMRIFKGSEATLAPQNQMDFVCSIQILRTLTLSARQEKEWTNIVLRVFNVWKNRISGKKNSKGKPLAILPHWGKEWDFYPEVKEHVLRDELMKSNFRKFLQDYKTIADLKKFDYKTNLKAFSNEIYRELLNNIIEDPSQKIQ